MDKDELLDILGDDSLGLLNVKPKAKAVTADERLVETLEQINAFYDENGKEPELTSDLTERKLFNHLKSIRENEQFIESLLPLDKFSLLKKTKKKSTNELLDDDEFGLLDSASDSIFTLKHIKKVDKTSPDYIARRKPCKDFTLFNEKFIKCHEDIQSGNRKILDFKRGEDMRVGHFFVLKGMLVYIDEINNVRKDDHGKLDARLRAIFENGTESDLLLRSLAKELYKDGRRVSEIKGSGLEELTSANEEELTGYIYVLKSLSKKPQIQDCKNLYKIGFCTTSVEDRIKGAETDPTYLMAPVAIVEKAICYGAKAKQFESLIHRFFDSARLDIEVTENDGYKYKPNEWFNVPLSEINKAIDLLDNGQIINYKFNSSKDCIELI